MRLPYEILAPVGVKALGALYAYILRCGIEKPLVDLVYLRSSQINGCAFCIDAHTHDALAEGIGVPKLMLVVAWREAGEYFTARERAALGWAEAVTQISETHAPDTSFQEMQAQFSAKEIVDLTIAIGLINAYNRMAISFRRVPASLANVSSSSI